MKPIHIFQHMACEGPGYFAEFLEKHQIPYAMICIDQNQEVSTQVEEVAGLVFMGGPMSVNDDLPWIKRELDLIKKAAQYGLPVLGHCLGGQLIAKALGGTITANKVKEIGWFDVVTAIPPDRDNLKLPPRFTAFHWHLETFTLPKNAHLFLSNEHCAHQGFLWDKMVALQCHIEITPDMVAAWVATSPQDFISPPPSVQKPEHILDQVEQKCRQLHQTANIIYQYWIEKL